MVDTDLEYKSCSQDFSDELKNICEMCPLASWLYKIFTCDFNNPGCELD